MKKLPALCTIAALAILLATPQSTNAQAQLRVFGKVLKFVGKTVATSAIESYVGNEIEQRFFSPKQNQYSQGALSPTYNQGIVATIVNDYYNATTYFWVTIDGYNWMPYMLYPGHYFSVRSNASGVIGIFNGTTVKYIRRQGRYNASGFFY